MPITKLTPDLREILVQKYQNGSTIPQLELEFGLSRPTISKALKDAGIQPVRKDNLFTSFVVEPDLEEKILSEYKLGKPLNKIQNEYNVPYKALLKLLESNGIERDQKSVIVHETKVVTTKDGQERRFLGMNDQQELVSDYINSGKSKDALAQKYDVSVDTVESVLDKNDVPSRRLINEEMEMELCDEFNKGFVTIYDLARIYRLNPGLIRYCLQKNGINPTAAVPGTVPTATRIRELAKGASEEVMQMMIDKALDPTIKDHDAILAGLAVIERAYGKVKDAPDESKDKVTDGKAKVLKWVPRTVRDKIPPTDESQGGTQA